MKRFILYISIIITSFAILMNMVVFAGSQYVSKDISVVVDDGFNIKAKLTYPKIKNQKEFSTVVLLHSLGTNSQWWGDLPDKLLSNGYAVLAIDLRGHGNSIYNKKLNRISWSNMTDKAFAKYPQDIMSVIKYTIDTNMQKKFFNHWAIVGSDIGANAGIIVADKMSVKPATIVILSPAVDTKGLYVPVHVAQLDNIDFLAISGVSDYNSINAANYLKKFAQNGFMIHTSPSNSTGMIMLKNDTELTSLVTEWIKQYLQ